MKIITRFIIIFFLVEELAEELEVSKARVDQKLSLLAEMQKEKVSEVNLIQRIIIMMTHELYQRLLLTMDDDAKGEISDNTWLKQQVLTHTHTL